ncbi:hypothetical protein [Desulfofustis limnaeus]|jgi:hypothetical protein|uniref:PCRF domain-containing protein n=1 Tax=Desulfofustis limnaeus TaxID=2740163 RepID=A0ABM7W5J5_9BACT|nr:hypothetical protein [Desulfofustis limnaeus]MDX9895430.1 hypothetical protein [Desulfofustis sp.]BDD86193.1 hypothetical protein DPPLL_05580 [Desulfofustis limnaeus]
MSDLQLYKRQVENNLKQWQKDLLSFRILAEEAEPDEQIKHYQVIEEIVAKEDAVKEKLAQMDQSGAVAEESLQEELEALQNDVQKAIDAARVVIN